ncbi:MAG TPA: methionine adenosyltransferase [Myxococcota bacterium]|nr:methionine adenosyltransferase [Myxococcota bacterium]
MDLVIQPLESSPEFQEVEIVERKGLGHPDTICDAIAERISVRLSRHYLERFEMILHHNVDKILLCGGSSRPCFGGGQVTEPIEIYLSGRATGEWRGTPVPVHEIAVAACRELLGQRLPELDLERHVRIIPRIRPGSTDLTRLFARGRRVPLANDTSCGAGFAPLSDLERVVLEVERPLNSAATKREHPAIGSDIKVMGVRRADHIRLTIGCAFIGRHLANIEEYAREKEAARVLVLKAARDLTQREVEATLNAADDLAAGDVFLTVTGTSAEAGDDGEVGRGNRTNGLITPYRSMTMEAAAGKNPVSHVGKLYNLVADKIAGVLVAELPGVRGAACVLVSQIGRPLDDPQLADVRLLLNGTPSEGLRAAVELVVRDQLARLPELRRELLEERLAVY